MVGGGGGGNQCNSDSSDVSASISGSQFHSLHPGGEKTTIEQPVLAKSSVTSTGQSIPSYATIWRPDNMSKYAVIGSSAAANYRGKRILEVSPSKERCAMCEFLGQLSSSCVVNLMIF